jgi:hypothetical protein
MSKISIRGNQLDIGVYLSEKSSDEPPQLEKFNFHPESLVIKAPRDLLTRKIELQENAEKKYHRSQDCSFVLGPLQFRQSYQFEEKVSHLAESVFRANELESLIKIPIVVDKPPIFPLEPFVVKSAEKPIYPVTTTMSALQAQIKGLKSQSEKDKFIIRSLEQEISTLKIASVKQKNSHEEEIAKVTFPSYAKAFEEGREFERKKITDFSEGIDDIFPSDLVDTMLGNNYLESGVTSPSLSNMIENVPSTSSNQICIFQPLTARKDIKQKSTLEILQSVREKLNKTVDRKKRQNKRAVKGAKKFLAKLSRKKAVEFSKSFALVPTQNSSLSRLVDCPLPSDISNWVSNFEPKIYLQSLPSNSVNENSTPQYSPSHPDY